LLDLKLIRDQSEMIRSALVALNTTAPLDEILSLDQSRRQIVTEVESLKARRNEGSKEVGRTKDAKRRAELIEAMRVLGDEIAAKDEQVRAMDEELYDLLLLMPNLPLPEVPVGPDESANVVTKTVEVDRRQDFPVRPHWEIAEELGIIDFDRGVKIAGTRNYVLRGDGARLQRALITWMIDLHTQKHGYTEVYPPYLVLTEMLVGTGQLPKFADTQFRDIEGEKWMIPTAEVPVTNLYREEILEESELPIYNVAYTACFRREQISAGRDVRGIKRGYQFDKVEMVKLVHPDTSIEEHAKLIADAEDVLLGLELPYRLLQIATGDLSFTAANKVDLEGWSPGVEEWLEVSSCSNFLEFQARRANIRFRPEGGGKPRYVHTLNGSGLALPRVMIAIMENYQLPDGTFEIPKVIQPYMGGQTIIGKQAPIGPARSRQ